MKWIKIEKIIPPDGRYLVFESRYKWIGVASVREGKFDSVDTTHWMPLPNAPCPENTLLELMLPEVEK